MPQKARCRSSTLEIGSYDHNDYGTVSYPIFQVIDWAYWDGEPSHNGRADDRRVIRRRDPILMDARAITEALGGKWQGRYGLCRCPAHADSNPSLKISDSDTRGIDVHCFAGCDWKDIKNELRRQGLLAGQAIGPSKAISAPPEEPKKVDWSLWHRAVPLPGTLGETYFIQHRKLKRSASSISITHYAIIRSIGWSWR